MASHNMSTTSIAGAALMVNCIDTAEVVMYLIFVQAIVNGAGSLPYILARFTFLEVIFFANLHYCLK